MKPVSDAYKASMKGSLRNRSFVRVTVQSVDQVVESEGTWTASYDMADWADLTTLGKVPLKGSPPATLELNYWDLDGTFSIIRDGEKAGYVSDDMSDENGDCDFTIFRRFDYTHTLRGYTPAFDVRANEWPVDGTIELNQFMEITPGAMEMVPMDVMSLSGMTGPTGYQVRPYPATDAVSITITKLLPYRRARIDNFFFGIILEFTGNEIVSTDQGHDVDPLSRRLPSENLEFTVIDFEHKFDPENPSGLYDYIYTRSPVTIAHGYEVESGVVEWLEPDGYILNARPVFDNARVTFRAGGLIASLTGSYWKDTTGTKTLHDMAIDVLEDAAAQGYILNGSWDIDSDLENIETTGVLPISTHAECLQTIAHAGRCVLYTDSSNKIHIEPFTASATVTNDLKLDYTTVYEHTQVLTRTDLLKAVAVSQYGYVDGASEAETLFSASTTDTEMHIEFPLARNVTVTVTGANVVSQHVYAQAVDLIMASGSKSIVITGIPLAKTETITTVDVNAEGETDSETNILITSDTLRDALSAHVRAYLTLRNTYEVTYRGNAELETRDVCLMQTRYSGLIPVLVLTNTLSFNGALRGTVKGKGMM